MASPLSNLLHSGSTPPPPPPPQQQPRPDALHTAPPPAALLGAAAAASRAGAGSASLNSHNHNHNGNNGSSARSAASSNSASNLPTPITPTTPAAPSRTLPGSDAGSHASSSSLYQCADCLRRYSRPEHLQRHIATHTLGKRFLCDVCAKAFARADLLKRHRANHDEVDGSSKRRRINSSPGAGRVAHACLACARARVKCEEAKPCARCRLRNIACEYTSAEAGSAAAMHLLHLSASAHSRSQPPESDAAPPPASVHHYHHHHHHHPQYHQHGRDAALQTAPPAPTAGFSIETAGESPAVATSASFNTGESQLPTPDTVMDQGSSDGFQPPYAAGSMAMADPRVPFSDFLRDIIFPLSDPPRMAEEVQGLAVLDFCDDTNLELNDIDFGVLDNWNIDGVVANAANEQELASRVEEPADMSGMRQRLVKIWTESPWRWNPNKQDSGYGEQANLPIPLGEVSDAQLHDTLRLDRVVRDKLEPSARDKILAIVLSTCKNNAMMTRVASSFPSAEAMDTLVHIFLASHLCQVSGWIDCASLHLNAQWPEWLACAASAGAVLTPNSTLRKFGFALQEAVRVTIPSRFEDNNVSIRDIGLVQALVLGQDIGLWSGNRRKMEIAECHLNIPITMIRYRGKFQRSQYPAVTVSPADQGPELEEKWARWREMESWKRLVFHCYLRDAQMSITTLTPPHISYSELTLPLPESAQLWFARTAQEWQMRYLEVAAGESKRPPSLGDLFRDVRLLSANHRRLDLQLATSTYLHAVWTLIWEFRQLNAVHRSDVVSPGLSGQNPNLLLSSRHQELVRLLQNFQLVTSDWHPLSVQESLVLNLLQMDLHVSLDDLQLFSGKEGEDQARRVYPTLQRWSETPEARQAQWHAGQILGLAKLFPPGHLKDFYAIAVHHAALALWTWGVVRKSMRQPATTGADCVYLDGPDSGLVQRYIGFSQGRAAIRGPGTTDGGAMDALLEDPGLCMEVAQDILRANFVDGKDSLPPIVENLCQLIRQLANAAWQVGLG